MITACLSVITLSGIAQSKKYEDAMKKNLALFDSAKKADDYVKIANGFERIALAEKKDWLSNYYAGMCYVLVAFEKAGDDIDTWCDKADGFIRNADSLSKNNSEVFVLKSMSASARIGVNPMLRGQKYGGLSGDYQDAAIKLDAKNPRAYLQKAQGIYFTPEMFGGGAKKAKPIYETAVEKFKTFKPASAIYPDWGKDMAQKQLAEINEKLNEKK